MVNNNVEASPGPSSQGNPRPSGSIPVNTAVQPPLYRRDSHQHVSGQPMLLPQPPYMPAFRNAGEGSVNRPIGTPRLALPPAPPPWIGPSPYKILALLSSRQQPQSPTRYNSPPVSARSTPLPGPFPQGPFHGVESSRNERDRKPSPPGCSTGKKRKLEDSKRNVHTPNPPITIDIAKSDDDDDDVVFLCSVDRARSGRSHRRVEAVSPTLSDSKSKHADGKLSK